MESFNLGAQKVNEGELIERVKQGERSAFDILVDLYKQRGLSVAYGIVGNLEDAQDILQEAFIRVYLNIEAFRQKSKFSTWFYRIVVNCSFDFLRQRKSRYRIFAEPFTDEEGKEMEFADGRYAPTKVILTKELAQTLDSCIADLPEKQKLCFTLKHQSGLSNNEISELLKCSVATVKVHLFRAVKALQDKIAPYITKEGGKDA